MTWRSWLRLVRQNLRRSQRQFVLSSIGIAVGIASLTFFLALSAGVRQVVLGRVFRVDRIDLEPPRSTLSMPLVGGSPRLIDDAQVERLRQVRGVRAVSPRMRLAFPARAWGGAEFFGGDRFTEVIGDGLDPKAMAGEPTAPVPFADLEDRPHETCARDSDCHTRGEYCAWDLHECHKPIPAVVSNYLLELYNSSIAGSHRLPRISNFLASRFRGFTFTMELGTSYVGARSARGVPRQRKVMLVGISDRAVPVGLSFPLPYVKRWNAQYAGAEAGAGYTSVTVEVDDKSATARVAAAARELGLVVSDSGAEQAGLAILMITLLFTVVSLAIMGVAVLNIGHLFYRAIIERRRELGVIRALGAGARDVERILLGEAAAVGLSGGLVGVLVAWLASLAVDAAAHAWVPDFPFKPDSFFLFSPFVMMGIVAFAVVVCLAGAWWPARSASRLEPAAALSVT